MLESRCRGETQPAAGLVAGWRRPRAERPTDRLSAARLRHAAARRIIRVPMVKPTIAIPTATVAPRPPTGAPRSPGEQRSLGLDEVRQRVEPRQRLQPARAPPSIGSRIPDRRRNGNRNVCWMTQNRYSCRLHGDRERMRQRAEPDAEDAPGSGGRRRRRPTCSWKPNGVTRATMRRAWSDERHDILERAPDQQGRPVERRDEEPLERADAHLLEQVRARDGGPEQADHDDDPGHEPLPRRLAAGPPPCSASERPVERRGRRPAGGRRRRA